MDDCVVRVETFRFMRVEVQSRMYQALVDGLLKRAIGNENN